jgi:hypothetical protein
LDKVLLPREVETALRLLSSGSSAPDREANVTLARYLPDFATIEAYEKTGQATWEKAFDELSELAKPPHHRSILCYFASCFVLIPPEKSRDEIIDIVRAERTHSESFEFINSRLAETNPSWFKSILTVHLNFTESAIQEINSTEYLATAIEGGYDIDGSLRYFCEVSTGRNIPIVLCLEGEAFTITPEIKGDEAIVQLDLLRDKKLKQSKELSRLLEENFGSLTIDTPAIDTLILIDHMMIHSLHTTGQPIVPASDVEETLNRAGVYLPAELSRWCQQDGQLTDYIEFEADKNAFLASSEKLFESANFASCLRASLQMTLANYLYAAYFGMQLFSPDEFLAPLVQNFPDETKTLGRYMQVTNRS